MTLAILDGGTHYHHEAIRGERYRHHFDRIIYAPDLTAADLEDVHVLIVPDRIDPTLLRRHQALLLNFLERRRTLVVLGCNEVETWVPGARWMFRPLNYWWWLDRAAVPVQRLCAPEHELFTYLPFEDTIWHFHGVLFPPAGAKALVAVPGDPENDDPGGALIYEDRVTTPSRLLVSTLDPFYHHGSHFMPAATRFLDGFLAWAGASSLAASSRSLTKRA